MGGASNDKQTFSGVCEDFLQALYVLQFLCVVKYQILSLLSHLDKNTNSCVNLASPKNGRQKFFVQFLCLDQLEH